jgi:hypothetical protein
VLRAAHAVEQMQVVRQHTTLEQPLRQLCQQRAVVVDAAQQH